MARYYDLVLGLIPLTFVSIAVVLVAAGLATTTAVTGGSLVSVGLVGHAMVVNGPVDSSVDTTTQATETAHQPAD
jgi:hypothetical protein